MRASLRFVRTWGIELFLTLTAFFPVPTFVRWIFAIGAVAIFFGVFCYDLRVMKTVVSPTRTRRPTRAARWMATLAAVLAGSRDVLDAEVFHADLWGNPDNHHSMSGSRQLFYACGLLKGALVLRVKDVAARLGLALDWFLATDARVGTWCLGIFLAAATRLYSAGGMLEVILNGENLACLVGGSWAAAVVARRVRGVPSTPRKQLPNKDH
jgi:hypothetical protein